MEIIKPTKLAFISDHLTRGSYPRPFSFTFTRITLMPCSAFPLQPPSHKHNTFYLEAGAARFLPHQNSSTHLHFTFKGEIIPARFTRKAASENRVPSTNSPHTSKIAHFTTYEITTVQEGRWGKDKPPPKQQHNLCSSHVRLDMLLSFCIVND